MLEVLKLKISLDNIVLLQYHFMFSVVIKFIMKYFSGNEKDIFNSKASANIGTIRVNEEFGHFIAE